MFSLTIVLIQLGSLAFIFLSGPLVAKKLSLFLLENLGALIILWAIYVMRVNKLRISPEVAKESILVTMGPYKYIRHPMYAGTILLVFSLVANFLTIERLIAGIVLFVDLLIKLGYEEKLLEAHFKDYKTYKKQTFKLVPYIY